MLSLTLDILLSSAFNMQLGEADAADFLAGLKDALAEVTLRLTNPFRCCSCSGTGV